MILHPSLEQNEVLSRIVVPDAHAQLQISGRLERAGRLLNRSS